jgi:hypothetical protein
MKRNFSLALIMCFLEVIQVAAQGSQSGSILSLVERGDFVDNTRVGLWEYYDHPKELSIKVNYTSGKLIFVKPDTSISYILDGNQWVKRRLTVPCRFGASITSLIDHYDKFTIPYELAKEQKFFSVWLTFVVGQDGLAKDPEIHGDPGYNVKEQIINLFHSAPNFWIVGIDSGKPVTSRMAIRFDYCQVCDNKSTINAKVLFTGVNPSRKGPLSNQLHPLLFSPDSKKILVMPSMEFDILLQRASVLNTETKEVKEISFDHIAGMWWINNDSILFMPKYYSRTPAVLATLSLNTNKITYLSDSSTFGHVLSPDRRKVAYTFFDGEHQMVCYTNLETNQQKVILKSPIRWTIEMWSPDGNSLLLKKVDYNYQEYKVLDTKSGDTRMLPIMNATVCGWSTDGSRI